MNARLLVAAFCLTLPLSAAQAAWIAPSEPSNNADIQPSSQEEAERLEALSQAQTLEEAMDYMTPEELAEELGLPQAGTQEADLESMIQNVGGGAVQIHVSIAKQTLTISSPEGSFSTRVSTARKGYATKRGCFKPTRMAKMHYSRKYHNSPMPHSIFYYGGFAIHGTNAEGHLGRPASHGCVRVSRAHAKAIFAVVARYGAGNTTICVN